MKRVEPTESNRRRTDPGRKEVRLEPNLEGALRDRVSGYALVAMG